ncbi:hypothetical protein VHEMI00391 [[Torrubiella] hemipterigena]|uniref:F-box domain-containing protein n=1 Tax=[Torrubiella] hemipterigena TaxID=1531966 RepID=A0A0A1T292_9HYPO|nr:hypothetical protein VHEMI00391 [[Torrubiella] hemipterigena]
MVQVLTNRSATIYCAGADESRDRQAKQAPDEHTQRIKELMLKQSGRRPPRRGWSLTDQQTAPSFVTDEDIQTASGPVHLQHSIPENGVLAPPSSSSTTTQAQPSIPDRTATLPLRPPKPPPRRSQSVTDKEPECSPNQPRPSTRISIVDLPPELHYAILDFLDPIDAVCLALTSPKIYDVNRRKNPKVPLSSRYSGPNNLEWAWRGGQHVTSKQPAAEGHRIRVNGQVYCRKCGVDRCELHRHLKSWMGDGYEYCEIKERYGKPAASDAKPYCYMASPKDRHRCGRHSGKKVVPSTTALV